MKDRSIVNTCELGSLTADENRVLVISYQVQEDQVSPRWIPTVVPIVMIMMTKTAFNQVEMEKVQYTVGHFCINFISFVKAISPNLPFLFCVCPALARLTTSLFSRKSVLCRTHVLEFEMIINVLQKSFV